MANDVRIPLQHVDLAEAGFWYSTAAFLAVALCLWVSSRKIGAVVPLGKYTRGFSVPVAMLFVLVGAIVGARLAHFALFSGGDFGQFLQIRAAGGSIYGVFAGGFIGLAIYAWRNGVRILPITDLLVPTAPIAITILRIGSFLSDELWGDATTVGLFARHPSQLYEATLCLAVVYPLVRWVALRPASRYSAGVVTGAFLIAYAFVRIMVDTTRIETLSEWQFVFSLTAAAICLVVGTALMLHAIRSPNFLGHVQTLARPRQSLGSSTVVAKAAMVGVISAGCGGPIDNVPNAPLPTTEIAFSNPDGDSRCGCAGSQAAFVRHSENGPRRITWVTNRTDRISGQIFDPREGVDVIDPGLPGRFIGCTIDAPTTSCRFDNRYGVRHTQRPLAVRGPELRALLGADVAFTGDRTCTALCTAGRDCLQLGVRYYQAVAPIVELIRQANTNNQNVPRTEVLRRLGIRDSDDTCRRGDIIIRDGLARNVGETEACQFPSRELGQSELASVGLAYNRAAPLRLIGVLPQETLVRAGGPNRSFFASETAVAVDDEHAPYLTFDGAGGAGFTRRYGGPVQSVARISVVGRPPQTIISTANGCIAVSERP